jgi:hypothetical protein
VADGTHFGLLSDDGEMSLDTAAERGLVSVAPRRSSRPLLVLGAVTVGVVCVFAANAVERHARSVSMTAGPSLAEPKTATVRLPAPRRAVDAAADRERKAARAAGAHGRVPRLGVRGAIAASLDVAAGSTPNPPAASEFGFEGVR